MKLRYRFYAPWFVLEVNGEITQPVRFLNTVQPLPTLTQAVDHIVVFDTDVRGLCCPQCCHRRGRIRLPSQVVRSITLAPRP